MQGNRFYFFERKVIDEVSLFLFYFLAFVFSTFTLYEYLITHNHNYNHYIYDVVEALVLSKIILIGQKLKLGERFATKPLFYSTLYKTLIFSCFVIVFSSAEHFITGFIHGKNFAETLQIFLAKGINIMLARALVMFFVFIFFFAFLETGRVLGGRRLFNLFFKVRTATF